MLEAAAGWSSSRHSERAPVFSVAPTYMYSDDRGELASFFPSTSYLVISTGDFVRFFFFKYNNPLGDWEGPTLPSHLWLFFFCYNQRAHTLFLRFVIKRARSGRQEVLLATTTREHSTESTRLKFHYSSLVAQSRSRISWVVIWKFPKNFPKISNASEILKNFEIPPCSCRRRWWRSRTSSPINRGPNKATTMHVSKFR